VRLALTTVRNYSLLCEIFVLRCLENGDWLFRAVHEAESLLSFVALLTLFGANSLGVAAFTQRTVNSTNRETANQHDLICRPTFPSVFRHLYVQIIFSLLLHYSGNFAQNLAYWPFVYQHRRIARIVVADSTIIYTMVYNLCSGVYEWANRRCFNLSLMLAMSSTCIQRHW